MALAEEYTDLLIWQRSFKLVSEVYRLTSFLPKYENYGIADQLRRSSVSVPSNIAEGFGRKSRAQFRQYLFIALGSLYELVTQLRLIKEIYKIDESEELVSEANEIIRMIKVFNSKLK